VAGVTPGQEGRERTGHLGDDLELQRPGWPCHVRVGRGRRVASRPLASGRRPRDPQGSVARSSQKPAAADRPGQVAPLRPALPIDATWSFRHGGTGRPGTGSLDRAHDGGILPAHARLGTISPGEEAAGPGKVLQPSRGDDLSRYESAGCACGFLGALPTHSRLIPSVATARQDSRPADLRAPNTTGAPNPMGPGLRFRCEGYGASDSWPRATPAGNSALWVFT
jgi:hypothetical protein